MFCFSTVKNHCFKISLLLLIFLFTVSALHAKNHKVVTVAYFESPNFQEGCSDDSKKNGYSYEYLLRISDYTGWEYKFIYGSWNDLFKKFQNGEIDLFPSVAYKEDRLSFISYPEHSMDVDHHYIFVRNNDASISIDNIKSLKNKRFGCIKNTLLAEELVRWKEQNNADFLVEYFTEVNQLQTNLENGLIDGFVGAENSLNFSDNVKILATIASYPTFLGVRKKSPEVLHALNFAINRMSKEDPFFLSRLKEKYYKIVNVDLDLTESEKEWINSHRKLRIGLVKNYMPFCGIKENQVTGVIIELFNRILYELHIEDFEIEYKSYENFQKMGIALSEDEVDLSFPVMNDRKFLLENGIACTLEVLNVPFNVAYEGNYSSKIYDKIVLNTRPSQEIFQFYPKSEIINVKSTEECLDYILKHKNSCTVMASYRLKYFLNNPKYREIKSMPFGNNTSYCIGVQKKDKVLLSVFNKGITLINKADFVDYTFNYIQSNAKYSVSNFLHDNLPVVFLFLFAISGLVIGVLALYLVGLSKNQKKTDLLNKQLKENQEKLELSIAERETQIQKITVLNKQLEEASIEQKNQINEITSLNEGLQKNYAIIQSMNEVYYASYYIDLKKGTFEELKAVKSLSLAVGERGSIYDAFKLISETMVTPDTLSEFKRFINFSTLDERMEGKSFITSEFCGKTLGWSQVYIIECERSKRTGKLNSIFLATRLIHEEKLREEAFIHREKLKLEIISNAIHGGFKTSKNDAYFSFNYISEQLANMLGYTVEELWQASNGRMTEIVNKEDVAKEIQQATESVAKNEMYTMNYRIRCKNGSWKNVEDRGYLIRNEDIEDEYWCFIVDKDELTEKTKALEMAEYANDALIRSQDALEKAREEAIAANSAKTQFLFNMSHDIRTPMNAIIGFANLLEKSLDDSEKRSDYLKKIQNSSTVLLSIINNVLEMARIEKGSVQLEETACDVQQISDSIFPVFSELMEQKGIEFIRTVDVQHNFLFCDAIKIREVFLNIISNAYKYTNQGGKVYLDIKELPSDKAGYCTIQTIVSDTGIGMSKDFLPHLFEEFSRENNTTANKIEGTGLGMPIVKRLLDFMGGKIEVESEKNKGSTFKVSLTHKIAEKEDLVEHSKTEINVEQFKEKRILLAEDNDLNAEIAMAILEEVGFIIERAEDGAVCVDMLSKAQDNYYSLILMDIQMPNMNGYEATKKIRSMENKAKADIPILAMTANAFEEDRRDAKLCGMNGHIAKPIDVAELMTTLSTILV